jgi:putative RNA 2'-phosphotransferase
LSLDEATALRVGERHGQAYIFRVDALAMHAKGFIFYLSDNGVWLTDRVPPEFLRPSSSTADSAAAPS